MSPRSPDPDTQPNQTPPLLGACDPPPLTRSNADGSAPVLLVCDHATRRFPKALGTLGVPESALETHIAYDIGAALVTERLAALLDAPALLGGYSRLVIDLNRDADCSTLIPETSDGVTIPGNLDLSAADREARIAGLYRPWHRAVASELDRLQSRHGRPPALIGIHSFTPVMAGQARPWHVGIIWDGDDTLPRPLMAALAAQGDLKVGDNEPYSAREPCGGTLETHALDQGRPGVAFEIRQDLLADTVSCLAWAARLATVLAPLICPGRSPTA